MIAGILKAARLAKGLSISAVAKASGISYGAICSYENDEIIPSMERLIKIANTLDILLDDVDLIKEDVYFTEDDITFTEKYVNKINIETLYFGTCVCGSEIFASEADIETKARTLCKNCFAKKNDLEDFGLNEIEIQRLNNMFQNNIVKRSIKLNVECTLTLKKYITLILKECHYCGDKPNQKEIINNKILLHNGLDRLDSTKGYTMDNVVPCCTTCNMAKGSLTDKEFLKLAEKIYKHSSLDN